MKVNKHTNIEQYAEWLLTASFQQIQESLKSTCKAASRAIERLWSKINRKKNRSCLWKAGLVQEPITAAPLGKRSTAYPHDWADQFDGNYNYRCLRMYENLQKEIAMEELLVTAQERLIEGAS